MIELLQTLHIAHCKVIARSVAHGIVELGHALVEVHEASYCLLNEVEPPHAASDAYHSGVFESNSERFRDVVCSLRCFDRQPARCRVLGWAKAAAEKLQLKQTLLGEVRAWDIPLFVCLLYFFCCLTHSLTHSLNQ